MVIFHSYVNVYQRLYKYISIHVILIVIVVFLFVSSEHDLIEKANIGNTMGLMGDDSGISPRCPGRFHDRCVGLNSWE